MRYDTLIVGAGAAGLFTLVELLRRAERFGAPHRIAVVDGSGEFFRGIAYGERSGTGTLCIHSLADFMPAAELGRFERWARGEDLFRTPEDGPGRALHAAWVAANRDRLAARDWRGVYFPRATVGRFFEHLARSTIEDVAARLPVSVETVGAAAVALDRHAHGFRLATAVDGRPGPTLEAARVVVAVGGTPRRRIEHRAAAGAPQRLARFEPYDEPFDDFVAGVAALAADRGAAHVVVAGANASASEAVYALRCLHASGLDLRATVISPGGRLPEFRAEPGTRAPFAADRLAGLAGSGLTAEAVHRAAVADLREADRLGVGSERAVREVSRAVGAALDRLSRREQQRYVDVFAHRTGALQRRIGQEYLEAQRALAAAGRLALVAGAVRGTAADGTVAFDPADGGAARTVLADAFVNCAGAEPLDGRVSSAFLRDLIGKGEMVPNRTGGGVRVDDRFACAPDLHVMGPLLAGNIIGGYRVWHAEHCGRIAMLAARLAEGLASGAASRSRAPRHASGGA